MKSAETHPTPQRVVDAIQTVAAWLREIEAAEALIAPTGGAGFHPRRQADELLAGWKEADDELAALRAALVRYGNHAGNCEYYWTNGACTCGWKELKETL